MTDITLMTMSWLFSSITTWIFTGMMEAAIAITILAVFTFSFVHWATL